MEKMKDKVYSYSKDINVEGIPIPDLYAKEYEDPGDALYLKALKLNKGFDKIIKLAMEYNTERGMIVSCRGSRMQVTEKSMPYLYDCVKKACEILNVEKIPDVYMRLSPFPNASTIGSAKPIILIDSGLLESMTHEELIYVIGHEIGHIKSEHCLYTMIGEMIGRTSERFLRYFKPGGLITKGIFYTFMEWNRRSEVTADHAGLLACQDLSAAITAIAKLAGCPKEFYNTLDANTFLEQAKEFKMMDENIYDKFLKFYNSLTLDHPWLVYRARELMLWVQSGEYARIVNRNSTWLKKEIERLSNITNKAFENKAKKYEKLRLAQIQNEIDMLEEIQIEEVDDEFIVKKILHKGQSGIKDVQAKINDGTVKKKQKQVDEADEKLKSVGYNEKQLRQIYKEVPESLIEDETNAFIGNLMRMEVEDNKEAEDIEE